MRDQPGPNDPVDPPSGLYPLLGSERNKRDGLSKLKTAVVYKESHAAGRNT